MQGKLIVRMLNFLQHLSTLELLHNYFDSITKIFLDLYLVKFLAKPFFSYNLICSELE